MSSWRACCVPSSSTKPTTNPSPPPFGQLLPMSGQSSASLNGAAYADYGSTDLWLELLPPTDGVSTLILHNTETRKQYHILECTNLISRTWGIRESVVGPEDTNCIFTSVSIGPILNSLFAAELLSLPPTIQIVTPTNDASFALGESVALARRLHFGAYALGAFVIACSLTMASWFYLDRLYADRFERDRAALVQQIEKNRAVLLKLAESHRTLELLQDPERPHRKLLVMKDASCWQSTRNQGVIEFND